jgi:hypothetical protein
MKEIVVNLFRDSGYLWLGNKAIEEAGFKEGTPYYQVWGQKSVTFTLDKPATPSAKMRRVNQHKRGACIRAEGSSVSDAFNGFKSVKAIVSPGRIEVVGHERTQAVKEVLPDPAGVAFALAGR